MWTKKYLLHPTKDEYFRTKHPIATTFMLPPLLVYYIVIRFSGINSPWLLLGIFGCLILGVGLVFLFAVIRKIYTKVFVPILALILGGILIIIGLYFSQR